MQINGARRWIGFGPFSVQPSEMMKLFLPLFFIHRTGGRAEHFKAKEFFSLLILMVIPLVLILFEPDNGTVAILFATLITLFLLSRVRLIYWALPLAILIGGGVVAAMQMKHVNLPDPGVPPSRERHPRQGAPTLPSEDRRRLWRRLGKGFWRESPKDELSARGASDYIAAIYAEESGFIGMLALVSVYMCLGYCGFRMASGAADRSAFLVISIITFLLCFQAFLNLGVVSAFFRARGPICLFLATGEPPSSSTSSRSSFSSTSPKKGGEHHEQANHRNRGRGIF